MQARGRFITLEGGEGVGKSVQAKRLEERLAALGLAVVRTREPGGSPGAEALREAILSGFARRVSAPPARRCLFAAARVDHLDKTILPALARGAWVVSDRFADFDPGLSRRGRESAAGVHRLARAPDRGRQPARSDADPRPRPGNRLATARPSEGGRGLPTGSNRRGCRFMRPFGGRSSISPRPSRCAARSSTPMEAKTTSPPPSGRRSKAGSIPRARSRPSSHEELATATGLDPHGSRSPR